MVKRSNLKTMNWQSVTKEQLAEHWDEFGEKGIPTPIDFETARYMNAYAYGDIAGEGIDVRCEHADEVVDVYLANIKSRDIELALKKLGWETIRRESYKLEMLKGDEFAYFDISENDEVGYMSMDVSLGYAEQCSKDITEYYEQAEKTIELFGREVVVNESNIVDLFQAVGKKYYDATFDAGEGMRNVYIGNDIIQLYPYNEGHFVYILKYTNSTDAKHTDYNLKEFHFDEQVAYLIKYHDKLAGESKHLTKMVRNLNKTEKVKKPAIDKKEMEKQFIKYCEEKGAFCYRNQYQGVNETAKEIVYITKQGIVYWYFDNNGTYEMPTMRTIAYPLPSKLLDEGIIKYLIEDCIASGSYKDIKDIADFLSKKDDVKDKDGVPHEYFYGWVWEYGSWDDVAVYEDLHLINPQVKKDCDYLKSIYHLIKDGTHVEEDGTLHNGATTEQMVGNAEQFCTYFKESGLSLQEFLKDYDDLSRVDSLWSKCDDFAGELIRTYVGEDKGCKMQNKLSRLMHYFVTSQKGASYFPKK